MLFFVVDPKHQLKRQSHQAYTPCKSRMLQWVTLQRHSDTSSEATSSISACIVKVYEEEPSMDHMVKWVQWKTPQLAVPSWMWEELRKCEDVDNVA